MKHFPYLFLFFFILEINSAQLFAQYPHIEIKTGQLFLNVNSQNFEILFRIKNWDHTWSFDGKPSSDIWFWIKTPPSKNNFIINSLTIYLAINGSSNMVRIDLVTPNAPITISPNHNSNLITSPDNIFTCDFTSYSNISQTPFKGFLAKTVSSFQINWNYDKVNIVQNNSNTNPQNQVQGFNGQPLTNGRGSNVNELYNTMTSLLMGGKLNNYKKSQKITTFFKMKFDMGLVNLPIYTNTVNDGGVIKNYSDNTNLNSLFVNLAIPFYAFKKGYFSLLFQPDYALGLSGGSGTTYQSLGGNSKLALGKNWQIFAEAGYYVKTGSYGLAFQVPDYINASINNYTTAGSAEFDIWRFGAGLKIPLSRYNSEYENCLELSVMKDNISTNQPYSANGIGNQTITDSYVFKATIVLAVIFFEGEYSKGYPTAGNPEFPIVESNQVSGDYYSIKFGLLFNL